MYNAINKSLFAAAVMAVCFSCSDKEKAAATELYNQCESAVDARNYTGALAILDTLDSRYPEQTAVRRDALRLRAAVMEGLAIDSIATTDAALAQATADVEQWAPRFRHVDSSVGLEGYYLPKGVDEKMMTASGIQARVSDKGYFYIVANVQGKSIGLKAIELISGADRVSSAAISPARIIRVEGSESASFNPEDLEAIGPWLESHAAPAKLVLVGSKGSVNLKFSDKQAQELKDCYAYSRAMLARHRALVKREKFERMLATARDQLANLPQKQSDK